MYRQCIKFTLAVVLLCGQQPDSRHILNMTINAAPPPCCYFPENNGSLSSTLSRPRKTQHCVTACLSISLYLAGKGGGHPQPSSFRILLLVPVKVESLSSPLFISGFCVGSSDNLPWEKQNLNLPRISERVTSRGKQTAVKARLIL